MAFFFLVDGAIETESEVVPGGTVAPDFTIIGTQDVAFGEIDQ